MQKRLDNSFDPNEIRNSGKRGHPYRIPPTSRTELIERLKILRDEGWIQTREQFNDGLVGNTLEDFLGIKENNITLPDAGRYDLKAQRTETGSLTTLFHCDPWPRKPKTVITHILGPIFGWPHKELEGEWSFRVTMYGNRYTNRGFKVDLDEDSEKLWVRFNPNEVDPSLRDWLTGVMEKSKGKTLPMPYWTLKELKERLERKLFNILYVHAKSRKKDRFEEFSYDECVLYEDVDFKAFKMGLKNGEVLVDFDARTSHNHGTKFRVKKGTLRKFYAHTERIF